MSDRRARTYFVLTVIGAIAPLALIGVFIGQDGLDFGEMADQVFGSPVAAAVMADVSISSVVFWVWMFPQARRMGLSPWPLVVGNIFIGLSFALPLFLYLRERRGTSTATPEPADRGQTP